MSSGSIAKRLAGRIAVVTASTKGIGFSIAQRLGQEGAQVIVSSRKKEHVDQAVTKLTDLNVAVKGVVCHVANAAQRAALFQTAERWGGLDILVSHAGVNPEMGMVLDCSEKSWDKLFDINLKSGYLLAKEAMPLLKKSKAGRIIFTTSISAFQTYDLAGAYSVSKTALLGLTKAASLQLASDEITVNSIAPGFINTQWSEFITTNPDNLETEALSKIPMNRYITRLINYKLINVS